MITKENVQHIAKLARLGLTEAEIKKSQKELFSILKYIGKLEEVDVSKVEPTSHSQSAENVTRQDEPRAQKLEAREKLFEMAPDKKKGHIKVKAVL